MGEGVRIFVTGGTIDKVYNPITEKLEFTEAHAYEILSASRVKAKVAVDVLMLKDSLYMTEADRQLILERCKGCLEDRILITHGTGSMVETAQKLGENLEGKTITLTGAMIPYSINKSDAVFNFAGAYYAALALPSGVYICMNGMVFPWNNVRKNTEKGHFERLT